MDRDKELERLQREIWWMEMQHKAREAYLLRRIENLEKEVEEQHKNTPTNDYS